MRQPGNACPVGAGVRCQNMTAVQLISGSSGSKTCKIPEFPLSPPIYVATSIGIGRDPLEHALASNRDFLRTVII